MELDNQLEQYRKLYGWTKEEFARKIGISRSTMYSLIERRRLAKIDTVYKISKLLNIPLDEVFFPKGDKPQLRIPKHILITEQ